MPDANERWEQGIPHDPRSEKIYEMLAEADWKYMGDHFCWKKGGDGDNGETLMYALDVWFEKHDADPQNPNCPVCGDG